MKGFLFPAAILVMLFSPMVQGDVPSTLNPTTCSGGAVELCFTRVTDLGPVSIPTSATVDPGVETGAALATVGVVRLSIIPGILELPMAAGALGSQDPCTLFAPANLGCETLVSLPVEAVSADPTVQQSGPTFAHAYVGTLTVKLNGDTIAVVPGYVEPALDGVCGFDPLLDADCDGVSDVEEAGETIGGAVTTLTGLLNGRICIAGAPAPLTGTCEDGHAIVAYMGGALGIEHFYADASSQPVGFSIGFHYVGARPSFCLNEVQPGHCEAGGTDSINDALSRMTDTDGDGFSNLEELTSSPRSNPFYKYSTPTNKGLGFPSDWDADMFANDFELKQQPATNPFQGCSNPNAGSGGWSPSNPTVSCEDTNPVGGF